MLQVQSINDVDESMSHDWINFMYFCPGLTLGKRELTQGKLVGANPITQCITIPLNPTDLPKTFTQLIYPTHLPNHLLNSITQQIYLTYLLIYSTQSTYKTN